MTRSGDLTGSLTVNLSSNDTGEATVSASVTIAAGEATSAPFNLNAVDDALLDGTQTVTITASATGYANGTDTVEVTDYETLTVTIAAASVGENAGTAATTATVTRSNTDTTSALTVSLLSNDTSEATVAATVEIPAGQASASFDLNAVDDTLLDGTQTVTITASATGYVNGSDTVDVTDYETLTVTVAAASFSENAGTAATTATVTRGNTDTTSALTVSLLSNDTGEATVAATVEIAAGQASATFDLNAVDDALLDGTQTVTITASATGYVNGSDTVDVTDYETLTVTIAAASISENAGTGATTATVTRSNTDNSLALTVNLLSDDTSEATVAASVEILSGQASATFDLNAVDDTLLDGTQTVTITASATGYVSGDDTVDVLDYEFDFGDAPDSSYPTLLANNGPRHFLAGATLGSTVDQEEDGQPTAGADGDDNGGTDDEDGVTFVASSLVVSASAAGTGRVQVDLQNADATANRLDAWIDFNQDGDWNDAGEQIFTSYDLGTVNGTKTLDFTIPAGALAGNTFSRFRLSTTGGLAPTGSANDGEVEDHPLTLLPNISIDDNSVTEGNTGTTTLSLTVRLSGPSSQAVTVDYATAEGTATPGTDYVAITTTQLTFAAGETSKTIEVMVNGDTQTEPNETLFVNLSNASGAAIADNQAVGTILDDDQPVLDPSYSPALTPVNEGTTNPAGDTVAAIVVDGSIENTPAGSEKIVVTRVDNTNGTWQFSTNAGATWSNFTATTGGPVDISSTARVLGPNDRIRFVPKTGFSSGVAHFGFRAWSYQDETPGGSTVDLTAPNDNPPFSEAKDTASITVNDTNGYGLRVSGIADRTTEAGVATGPVAFAVTNPSGSPVTMLFLSATSSDPAIVPRENITFAGTGGARTVTVTPLAGVTGVTTITVSADNGLTVATTSFELTVLPQAPQPSLVLTAPTSGTFTAGQSVTIQWTAEAVEPGSTVSLCYDEDTTWWNGNEHWIEVDQVAAANGAGSYEWNTAGIQAGTYYVAGYLYHSQKATSFSHLTGAIEIEPGVSQSFVLTGPASGTFTAGDVVNIQWTAAGVVPGSTISLCYDEDTTWWNGNEHWIEIDQVTATNGNDSYNWNTTGVTAGTYYLAGYMYDWAGTTTIAQLTGAIQIQAGVSQSFVLTGPSSGIFTAGESVSIEWTATGVVPGSTISLCYDEDTTWWNGNEHWIEVDQVTATNGNDSYNWNTADVAAGSYYLAGYMYDWAGTTTIAQLTGAIQIQAGVSQSFVLTGPSSGTFTAGESVSIQWTAAGVVPGSTISLCYDEDTTWWNGNEHWIEVDQVAAANGSHSYNWDTAGVGSGTYYIAGYLYDPAGPSTFSHLSESFQILAGDVPSSFSLTGPPAGFYPVGDTVAIEWAANGVTAGSTISLCYDEDTTWWNGNEHWIEVDQVPAVDGTGTYEWDTTSVTPGTYYLAGYLYDPAGPSIFSHREEAIVFGAPLLLEGQEIAASEAGVLTDTELQPIASEAIADWTDLAVPSETAEPAAEADVTEILVAADAIGTEEAPSSSDALLNRLASVSFVVVDLPGTQLALAAGTTFYVDIDAAGHGWFIDSTPESDEEFQLIDGELRALDPQAVDRVDLLTVLDHELGHVLGLDDLEPSDNTLMSSQLAPGVRRLPSDLEIDALFSQWS